MYKYTIPQAAHVCTTISSTLATDAACELDVLGHDGDALGVDCAQVGVLKQTDQVGLSCLLQSEHCGRLKAQIGLVVLGNLTNQALEWQLADQQVGGLLVLANLTQGDGTRAVAMGLFDTTGGGGRLASSLGCELLTGGLATCRLAGSLLGTSHSGVGGG